MDDNRRFWDRCAKFYTLIQENSNLKLYREINSMAMSYLNRDMEVLELACGSGQFTKVLSPLVKHWEATDFSSAMIEQAQKLSCPASFSREDATCLSCRNRSFHCVLIGNALHIMPEPRKALSEIHRVLKPGGILIAPTFIYEGRVNKVRMKLTEILGFQTFHKWDEKSFIDFVEESGFRCISSELVPGNPLPMAFSVFRKTE